jgi:hypothetical protein
VNTGRARWRSRIPVALVVAACAIVVAATIAGCSSTSSPSGTSITSDQKAMVETVGKWYVAEGSFDIPALKAIVYDPNDIMGLATATPPAGALTTTVTTSWQGEKLIISAPSIETTIVAMVATSTPNAVAISDGTGQSGILIMKKISGAWKIDVAETQKASSTAAGAQPPSDGTSSAP